MALKIRLARGGAKKRPFYRIVIAENTAPRDGLFIEKVGTYNPMVAKDHPQRLVVQEDRVKHWLSVGARPTDRVHKFLASLDLMPAFEYREQPKKSAPGKKRIEREAEAAAKAAAAEEAPAETAAEEAPAETAAEEAPAQQKRLQLKPQQKRLQPKPQQKRLRPKPQQKRLQPKPQQKRLRPKPQQKRLQQRKRSHSN